MLIDTQKYIPQHMQAIGELGATFEKYIVPRASHPTVTGRACPGRQLPVVRQVTASTSYSPNAECDRPRESFAIHYDAEFRPADGDTCRA
jgi:hypothetical protein